MCNTHLIIAELKGDDDDVDSISGSSCKSHESSPSTSPFPPHRPLTTSSSMNELLPPDGHDASETEFIPFLFLQVDTLFWGVKILCLMGLNADFKLNIHCKSM